MEDRNYPLATSRKMLVNLEVATIPEGGKLEERMRIVTEVPVYLDAKENREFFNVSDAFSDVMKRWLHYNGNGSHRFYLR